MIVHCPTQRGPKPVPQAKPGDIRLRAGDILLLDTGSSFAQQHRQSKYFSIVLEMENTNPVSRLGQQLRTIIVAAGGGYHQAAAGWLAEQVAGGGSSCQEAAGASSTPLLQGYWGSQSRPCGTARRGKPSGKPSELPPPLPLPPAAAPLPAHLHRNRFHHNCLHPVCPRNPGHPARQAKLIINFTTFLDDGLHILACMGMSQCCVPARNACPSAAEHAPMNSAVHALALLWLSMARLRSVASL